MWVEATNATVVVQELTNTAAPAPDTVVARASHAIPITRARRGQEPTPPPVCHHNTASAHPLPQRPSVCSPPTRPGTGGG